MSAGATIIAEAGVNHNGQLDLALQLVDAAAEAGADVVKFQTFSAARLVSPAAPKAEYQAENTGEGGGQLEMLAALELSAEDHRTLQARAAERGVEFLSTPFDLESARFLAEDLGLGRLKIPSGELTNAALLWTAAHLGVDLIVSTGMGTLAEVEAALGVLAHAMLDASPPGRAAFRAALDDPRGWALLHERVTLLHCTTQYPTPFDQVDLRAMDTLGTAFGLRVGLSDHTAGIAVPVAAVARGARVIEKHFTLDQDLPGPDHKASLEPDDLAAMVRSIREVEAALGHPRKVLRPCEVSNRTIARKSLATRAAVAAGEPLTPQNLTALRPEGGRDPMDYFDLLGRPSPRAYPAGAMLEDPLAPGRGEEGSNRGED